MDIVEVELAGEVGDVRQRHISVEELQRLAFVGGQLRIEHGKEVASGQQSLFQGKVLLHAGAVRIIGDEMGISAARGGEENEA